MYRDIRGHILFCLNSSAIKRFPLKGESVKGGSTVYSYCYAIRYVSKIIPTPGSGLICPFTALITQRPALCISVKYWMYYVCGWDSQCPQIHDTRVLFLS